MKKHIITAIIAIASLTAGFTIGKASATDPQIRVMTGNYYDYMVVETVDGNSWMIDGDIAPFEDGELVQVSFDTKGTDSVLDDEILDIRSIDPRY